MIKSIYTFFKKILDTEIQGFYYLFLIISRGFFLVLKIPFFLLSKITNNKIINNITNRIGAFQENPIITLTFSIIFSALILYNIYLYVPKEEPIKIENNIVDSINNTNQSESETKEVEEEPEEYNLYRKFSSYKLNDINFNELREINSNIVSWIIVDGTNINYPIVQTNDNDYYLNHDINNMQTINGWTFMDYRNDSNMNDNNTIFYGHNLFNKTAFGSISNIFTDEWFNTSNHKIVVLTENNIFTYEIFSIYYSEPDSSYLKINYNNKDNYQEFLNNIKNKSEKNFPVEVTSDDRIITLSTCTDDNNGRKVVHAKII